MNRLFFSSFKDDDALKSYKQYYVVEIKDYNIVIDGRNVFVKPIRNDLKHMITLERLQLVKVMITQLDIY